MRVRSKTGCCFCFVFGVCFNKWVAEGWQVEVCVYITGAWAVWCFVLKMHEFCPVWGWPYPSKLLSPLPEYLSKKIFIQGVKCYISGWLKWSPSIPLAPGLKRKICPHFQCMGLCAMQKGMGGRICFRAAAFRFCCCFFAFFFCSFYWGSSVFLSELPNFYVKMKFSFLSRLHRSEQMDFNSCAAHKIKSTLFSLK